MYLLRSTVSDEVNYHPRYLRQQTPNAVFRVLSSPTFPWPALPLDELNVTPRIGQGGGVNHGIEITSLVV